MADYGLLQEIRVDPRGSSLTAAASVSDTELVVDTAGDFSEDGGTLDLNGTQLAYTGIDWGVTEDDDDTIILLDALAVGADVDDDVKPVSGGQAEEDWWGVVDMGDGDPVQVPISYGQRQTWAPGVYDPPVRVVVTEDLSRIEDAPGRPAFAGNRVAFWNTDEAAATGPGDLTFTLTHTPIDGSLHVRWNGLSLRPTDWTLDGTTLTVLDPDGVLAADDAITTAYAYDLAAGIIASTPIETIIAYSSSGWKYKQVSLGDGTDYSSPSYDDSAWSSGATKFGNGVGSGAGAATNWDENTSVWVRKTFPKAESVTITVPVEDGCDVYVNGTLIGSSGIAGVGSSHLSPPFVVEVSDALVGAGTNTLAVRANDEAGGSADETSLNIEVTGRVLT